MKIAFCISGQLRDDHVSLGDVSHVARQLGADVFVSVWRKRGTKSSGVINIDQAQRMFGDEFADCFPEAMCNGVELSNAVPLFSKKVAESLGDVTRQDLLNYFPNAMVDIEDECLSLDFSDPGVTDVNTIRMLYKVWRCNEMKKLAERTLGVPYNVVIRMRPDVLPSLPLCLDAIKSSLSRTIFIRSMNKPNWLDDVFSLSDSCSADIYASLFGKAILHPQRRWNFIHRELFDHILEHGLVVKPIRLERFITADNSLTQPRNRSAMLELIEQGLVNKEFFPRASTWRNVFRLLSAADVVCKNGTRVDVETELAKVEIDKEDHEFLGRTCSLMAKFYNRVSAQELSVALSCMAFVAKYSRFKERFLRSHEARNIIITIYSWALLRSRSIPQASDLAESCRVVATPPHEILNIFDAFFAEFSAEVVINSMQHAIASFKSSAESQSLIILRALHAMPPNDRTIVYSLIQGLIDGFPSDWRGVDHLGHYYQLQGNLERALDCAKQANMMVDNHGPLTARVGEVLMLMRNHDEADSFLTRATEIWSHPHPWRLYINNMIHQNRIDAAREATAKALTLFPDNTGLRETASRIGTR